MAAARGRPVSESALCGPQSGLLLISSASAALFSLVPSQSDELRTFDVAAAAFFLAMSLVVWFLAPPRRRRLVLDGRWSSLL